MVCPEDIFVTCDVHARSAVVDWEPPSGDGCCSSCDQNTQINGFTFLGERGGHRYYLSQNEGDWQDAIDGANQTDGYLAVIDDPVESRYLAGFLDGNAYIGLSDEGSEGNFYWLEGTPFTFLIFIKQITY